MKSKTTAMALVAAACGLGVAAAPAGAVSIDGISGNPYTYTATGTNHSFSVSGITVTCANVRHVGTATGASWTDFQTTFGGSGGLGTNCTSALMGPVKVTANGPWRMTATSATTGTVTILPGSSVTIKLINIPTCTITVGPQVLTGLTSVAYGSPIAGTNTSGTVGFSYTRNASSCLIPAAGTMTYNTNGNIQAPGVVTNP